MKARKDLRTVISPSNYTTSGYYMVRCYDSPLTGSVHYNRVSLRIMGFDWKDIS